MDLFLRFVVLVFTFLASLQTMQNTMARLHKQIKPKLVPSVSRDRLTSGG